MELVGGKSLVFSLKTSFFQSYCRTIAAIVAPVRSTLVGAGNAQLRSWIVKFGELFDAK
jgi:hypothetical protein